MRTLNCLRCGSAMGFVMRERFQLGQTGLILGDLPNLLAGSLELDVYGCPQCGKLEFFQPETAVSEFRPEPQEGLPPEAGQRIIGVSADGVPQVRCPSCGKNHDFDYPKCPCCDFAYD